MLFLVSEPFSPEYILPILIPVILLHFWSVLYFIDPYKFELSYYLFAGILGLVNTITYFLVIQKFLYLHIEVTGPIFFVISLLLFLSLIVFFQIFHLKMLHSGKYAAYMEKGTNMNGHPIILASCSGYIVGQFVISLIAAESILFIILITCITALSVFTSFNTTYIQRYLYLKKHYKEIKKVRPNFGLSKNDRKL
ncbi:hypothetical protein F9U64_12550 [Gracilibacillus oryzae]|uniref:Uncharacterized protein n=2 Tax=Gracilibacillus oryzae TaxID=1672701 RepID=A0A7C8GSS8_9BACI|nr:hypothetical protein F9U64_12550 [Gracilibacillus oryzae]